MATIFTTHDDLGKRVYEFECSEIPINKVEEEVKRFNDNREKREIEDGYKYHFTSIDFLKAEFYQLDEFNWYTIKINQ